MAPVSVPCPAGGSCTYKTPELEFNDAMALLTMHERQRHSENMVVTRQEGGKKPEKFPRPTIGIDETSEKWQDFHTAWVQYKDEYDLRGPGVTRQLYACCSSELATGLSRVTGGRHFTLDENTLIQRMKELAVQYQNPAVYVQEFLAMAQQPDEGVRHYLSRLKGVASHCDFSMACTFQETVSYADHITRFKLVAGLEDEEIKEDIFGTTDKTLEDIVKAVEAKASVKRAKVSLGGNNSGHVNKVEPTRSKSCTHCGGRTNQRSSQKEREK